MSGLVCAAPAQVGQPVDRRVFDIGFGEGGHGVSQGLTMATPKPTKCLTFLVATDNLFASAVPVLAPM